MQLKLGNMSKEDIYEILSKFIHGLSTDLTKRLSSMGINVSREIVLESLQNSLHEEGWNEFEDLLDTIQFECIDPLNIQIGDLKEFLNQALTYPMVQISDFPKALKWDGQAFICPITRRQFVLQERK